jgi:hypothetical protein
MVLSLALGAVLPGGPLRAAGVELEVSAALLTRGGYRGNALRDELLLDAARRPVGAPADLTQAFDAASYLGLVDDSAFWLVWASVDLALGLGDVASLHATVDSGAIGYERVPADAQVVEGAPLTLPSNRRPFAWTVQGRDPADEAAASGFVRELSVRLALDEGAVAFGKRRFRVGEGYVYDDYGVGVSAQLEVATPGGRPLLIGGSALLPARDWVSDAWTSPLVSLTLELEFSPLESVRLEGVYFHDDLGAFGATVQAAGVAELVEAGLPKAALVAALAGVGGGADLGWLVAAADVLVGAVLLHARALGVFGSADLPIDLGTARGPVQNHVTVLAFGGDLSAEWLVSDALVLEAFALLLTGDDRPPVRLRGGDRLSTSFVGVVPFWTFTNLFFQGGLNEAVSQRGASPAGVAGAGVVAAGLGTLVTPHRDWSMESRVAYLWAMDDPPTAGGGRGYGLELDFELRWRPLDGLGVAAEADVLFPGSAFAGDAPFWKVQAGLDFVY